MIVRRHQREALRDGTQTRRLGSHIEPVSEVRPVHYARHGPERRIVGTVLCDQRFERTLPPSIRMRIRSARRIETGRAFATLDVGHRLRIDEEQFRIRVDEAADQPCRRGSVHLDAPPGNPDHHAASALSDSDRGGSIQPPPLTVRIMRPIIPAATMTRGSGTRFTYTSVASVPMAISPVGTSKIARRPSTTAAPAIAPVAAAVTPSTKAFTARFPAKR